MLVVLDPPTPSHLSLVWRVHDGYFRHRGISAWTAGEVPWYATSNLPTARAHAAFLLEVAPAEGPVTVLEVGSGLGQFAVRFVAALRKHLGERGRQLLARLRYLLTDFSEKSLREAIGTPAVAAELDAGVLVPLVIDVRDPTVATDLDGARVALPPLSLVLGSYVACVLPSRSLQFRGPGGWFEQWLQVSAEVDDPSAALPVAELRELLLADPTKAQLVDRELALDVSWVRSELAAVVPDAVHRRALEALTAGGGDLTVSFPHGTVSFVEQVAPLLAPWGYVLVNDYGTVDPTELDGLDDRRPQVYGNSLAHGVAFPALTAWAAAAGWGALCTTDPLESVHSVALRPAPWSDAERAAWRVLDEGEAGDEIVDASTVAKRFVDQGQPERALRFFRRCLELEPDNVEHLHRAGAAALATGRYELAVRYLSRGREVGPDSGWDFEFQLGRATYLLEDLDGARSWYEQATEKEDHPVTWTNLGIVYEELGREADAVRCYEEAQRVEPGESRSLERLNAARDRVWAAHRATLLTGR
jgi:Flp pilus assembly protein TadD